MPFGPTSDASPGRFRRTRAIAVRIIFSRSRPRKIHAYVATGRAKHPAETTRKVGGEMTQKMRQELKRAGYRSRYRLRKQIVEPVFGQIKQARGFRQFLLRGLEAVQAEWALICTAHNITKLAKAIRGRLSQILTPSRRYLDGLLGVRQAKAHLSALV